MKRKLFLLGVIGITWFFARRHFEERASFVPSSEVSERIEENKTSRVVTPINPTKAGGSETTLAEKLSETPERVEASSTPVDEAASNAPGDMSAHKEEWFSFYRKKFGGRSWEVEGKVTILHPGYEGKFGVQFLVPSLSQREDEGVPIFLFDTDNPASNSLGSGSLVHAEGDRKLPVMKFVGVSIQPFFRRKIGEQNEEPGVEPREMTMVLFPFDPQKKKSKSEVEVRLKYQTEGPTIVIGKMDYEIRVAKQTIKDFDL